MLNENSKQVLNAIRNLSGEDGNYKIIEAEEILDKISADMTKIELSAVIKDLKERDYVKVKYFTPDEYCLITVKRAEEIEHIVEEAAAAVKSEPKVTAAREKVIAGSKPISRGFVFLFAFLGGLLGGGIVAAIAILLQIFLI